MTTEAQTNPPPSPPRPAAAILHDGYRVAISAARGPRTYIGPRALLWSGKEVWTVEVCPPLATEFRSIVDALNAALEVFDYFDWGAAGAKNRIVEIIDTNNAVVHKAAWAASGLNSVRLM